MTDPVDKLEKELADLLAAAAPGDIVRVVGLVRSAPDAATKGADPADFPDRLSYRKAMIARQKARFESETGSLSEDLDRLGVKHHQAPLTRTVVIDGTPDQILKVSELEEIETLLSNRVIGLGDE